jgi:hypothetical protein
VKGKIDMIASLGTDYWDWLKIFRGLQEILDGITRLHMEIITYARRPIDNSRLFEGRNECEGIQVKDQENDYFPN